MKMFAIFCMAFVALLYLIAAVITFLLMIPVLIYDFTRWFLDSSSTPRK